MDHDRGLLAMETPEIPAVSLIRRRCGLASTQDLDMLCGVRPFVDTERKTADGPISRQWRQRSDVTIAELNDEAE